MNHISIKLTWLILLFPVCVPGQSVSVTVTNNPSFSFTTVASLQAAGSTSPYTLKTNAFAINVDNDNDGSCKVYLALESPGISTASSTPMAPSILKVKFNHTDAGSNATGIVTADIPMTVYGGTGSPGTLLFTQKKKNRAYTYYYDVKLPRIGYIYGPGNYSYTFRVTMSVQ